MNDEQESAGMRREAHNHLCLRTEVYWLLCPDSP
jgi:hypothetical protein